MFSFSLRELARMESHRGVGYLIFGASIFPSTFLAQYFSDAAEVRSNLLVSCLVAACVGLLITSFFVVTVFNGFTAPDESQDRWKKAGAGALAVGSGVSLLIQLVCLLLSTQPTFSFNRYLTMVSGISASSVMGLVVYDVVIRFFRKRAEPGKRN